MNATDYQNLAMRTNVMVDGYQALANEIVRQAADDYFNILAGFGLPPPLDNGKTTKESLERFFHSKWYKQLTDVSPDYLIKKLKEKAESMVLIYTVGKEKGSSKYFVCRVGENTPLTQTYTTKKKALHKAAEMQEVDYKTYMKIRRRDGVDNAEN